MADHRVRTRRVWAVLVLSASALGGAGCQTEPSLPEFTVVEEEWSYGQRPGRLLVTDHFEIRTTAADAEFVAVLPLFLESAYQQYSGLIPTPVPPEEKLQTYIFANRGEWDRYVRETFPARYPVYARISAGAFAERNQCVAYYMPQRIYTLSVIAHEGLHQYLGAMFSVPVPAWLNEGLACYCETFQFKQDVPVFTPQDNSFRMNSLRQSLAGDSLIPLKEMLATDAGQVIVRSQSATTRAYYAQAWALVCMLRHGVKGKYRDGFDRMCADMGTRESLVRAQAARIAAPDPSSTSLGEALFRAYITTDLEAFEPEYQQYMRQICEF